MRESELYVSSMSLMSMLSMNDLFKFGIGCVGSEMGWETLRTAQALQIKLVIVRIRAWE